MKNTPNHFSHSLGKEKQRHVEHHGKDAKVVGTAWTR
jgi:hypothetical protein